MSGFVSKGFKSPPNTAVGYEGGFTSSTARLCPLVLVYASICALKAMSVHITCVAYLYVSFNTLSIYLYLQNMLLLSDTYVGMILHCRYVKTNCVYAFNW